MVTLAESYICQHIPNAIGEATFLGLPSCHPLGTCPLWRERGREGVYVSKVGGYGSKN